MVQKEISGAFKGLLIHKVLNKNLCTRMKLGRRGFENIEVKACNIAYFNVYYILMRISRSINILLHVRYVCITDSLR